MKRLLTLFIILLLCVPAYSQEQAPTGPAIGGYPHLSRLEIPFTGKWQIADDPLLLDKNSFSDIKNMRYTDKSIQGVNGYSKINTAPFFAGYDYTDFTEDDTPTRISVAAHVITMASLDTDEQVSCYYDEGAAHFDGDFEHQLDFECTASTNGVVGLWALSNTDPAGGLGLFGLADGDLDHLSLRSEDISTNSAIVLLTDCDGADTSTTFTDKSSGGHTITTAGNAQVDTAQKKFGTGAAYFSDGLGVDRLTIPDSANWFMDTGKFAISAWIRIESITGQFNIFEQYVDANNFARFRYSYSTSKLEFSIYSSGSEIIYAFKTASLVVDTWYHVAATRGWDGDADDFVVTLDGVPGSTATDSDAWPDFAGEVRIGRAASTAKGWIDELCVWKGEAPWVADFSDNLPTTAHDQYLILQETNGVTDTPDKSIGLGLDTDYYVTPKRDESVGTFGTLYALVYSDEARETLIDTLTITLTEKQDFEWVFGMIAWEGASGGVSWSGTISNLVGSVFDDIKSSYHFKKDQPAESHILVQAANNAGATKIFFNDTAIPNQGNFESTVLYTDATGASRGRFVSAPQGNVVYCNGKESLIWGGDELRCAAFILATAAVTNTVTDARDFTEQVQNTLDDSDEVASVATPYLYGLFGATRPLKGVKFYVSTPNATTSNVQFEEWTGTAWSALTETDNTASGGIAFATTGTVTWATTEATSKVKYLEGRVLYWYQWVLSAGSALISHVTVDAGIQKIKNIWSGDPSVVAACKKYDTSVYYDYTVEVNDAITSTIADLDSLGTTHSLLLGFLRPQQAFEVFIPPGKGNGDANTIVVNYWDGDSFEAVSGFNDGTSDGSAALAKSGVINFTPPARGTEFPTTISQEGPYYYYEIKPVTAAMDAETEIYYITGIDNPPKIPAHKFAINFQTRVLLCSLDESPEAVLVSAENAPDVYNGDDSTTLYFGGADDLVAGVGLYNRHGSSIYNMATLDKKTETWILTGFSPDTFEKNQISDMIGCVAPLTIDTCEVGYQLGKQGHRNITVWLSYTGPVLFDGGVIVPIRGMEPYFDPNDDLFVGYTNIEDSVGSIDPLRKEYNLIIGDLWLVYDLIRAKWFKKEPPQYPTCMFRAEDTDGAQYGFIGFDDGYIRHNENGTTFDGTAIDQSVTLRDLLLTQSMWDITRLDFIKLICDAKNSGNAVDITMEHRADGSETWATLSSAIPMYSTGNRYSAFRLRPDKIGVSHELKLSCSTSDKTDGFEPIALGILYHVERTDTIVD